MALARLHTWVAGEVLTASDLNGEFNNILNNATALITPLTSNLSLGGFSLTNLGMGSASTPSLSFSGDANTGLFSPSADQISLSAGGATAFSIVSRTAGTAYAEFRQSAVVGGRFYPPLAFGNPDDGVMSVTTGTIDLVSGGQRVLQASAFAVTVATNFVPASLDSNPPVASALYKQNVPKAWVNFIGRDTNGAATINSAFNVSSVTRIGLGQYTITYGRAFATASHYAIAGSGFFLGNSAVVMGNIAAPTVTAAHVIFFSSNSATGIDPHECMVTVMGNQ